MAQMYILFRLTSVGALFINKPICFCVQPLACCGHAAVCKFSLLLQVELHFFCGYFSLELLKWSKTNFMSSHLLVLEFFNNPTMTDLTFVILLKVLINYLSKLF